MSQVRVGVRIRPLTADEQAQGGKSIVNSSTLDSTVELLDRKFTFDSVYDESVPQDELYNCVGSDRMLEAFLDGYNSTIMAYGQTGSGKTFTMGSEANYSSLREIDSFEDSNMRQGLIPRFMADIFQCLQRRKHSNISSPNKENIENIKCSQLIDYKVSASFLEVYGENIHDLLSEDSRQVLPLREDETGKIVVVGLKEQPISSAEDALQMLHEGTLNRTTAATLMNKKSSRSHAVFTIHLRQTIREMDKGSTIDVTTVSCFTFVDLAGSERMKKTGAEGERAKEGIMINQGLLALGNVINALADEERLKKGKKVHVPYRESKLTRLLQDALGGNSQTLFLACISPSDTNASETASTLKYANRARNIRNIPTKNIDATHAELQRLYSLNNLLERELVRSKFGTANTVNHLNDSNTKVSDEIGLVDDNLLTRDDVKEYLSRIYETANEKRIQSIPQPLSISQHSLQKSASVNSASSSTIVSISQKTSRNQIIQNIDECILGVDPDGDIALLDKLLELQRLDQDFEHESKIDQDKLEEVVGELAAQEQLLLQLKNNLQGYHHLKERFESMMIEIQSLENEKALLAKELQNVQVDPSKGCSKSIKKRLEDVESKLERTRVEGQKHQQMYRKAEQEAKKAAALQQKIDSLKQGKVALMKKQREAVAKYREASEAKSREINMLKRNEKKVGQQLSKLETEVRNHKMHLQRRNEFCSKLSEKLKQTESHLMKVISMRKREMLTRTTVSQKSTSQHRLSHLASSEGFAPDSEEISSMKFLLEKLIHDRVNLTVMKSSYEVKVSEYSDLMRSMVSDMKLLKTLKEKLSKQNNDDDNISIENEINHVRDNIEDAEFRIHILEKELEKMKSKLPGVDDPDQDETNPRFSKFENDAIQMISNLSNPIAKRLLKDMIDLAAQHQASKLMIEEKIKRKDAALSSFENEIECLNRKITVLSREREVNKGNSPQTTKRSQDQDRSLITPIDSESDLKRENNELLREIEKRKRMLDEKDNSICVLKEKLAVMEVTLKHSGNEVKNKVKETVEELQKVWEIIGVSSKDRDSVRQRIESCLEFSCSDELQIAKDLKLKYEEDITVLQSEISNMCKAMGIQTEVHWKVANMKGHDTLVDQILVLEKEKEKLQPSYLDALQRRSKLANELRAIMESITISTNDLPVNLSRLLKLEDNSLVKRLTTIKPPKGDDRISRKRRATQIKHVESIVKALEDPFFFETDYTTKWSKEDEEVLLHDSNSLSDSFLDLCHTELKGLTMKKAEIKVTNQTLRESAKELASSMHVRGSELLALSIQSIKKRDKDMPTWWNQQIAESVCRAIVSRDSMVEVGELYSKHLSTIHQALYSTSISRKELSSTLKEIVKKAHESLIHTVQAQLEENDDYSYFDAALARLPPFSKEYVSACIDEMKTLVEAVNAMSQSEVEALTVVWDALSVRNSDKGEFWGRVEESSRLFSLQNQNPFESVLKASKNDVEDWVYGAVKEAQIIQRSLSAGLMKLNKIHDEVERLSEKQNVKSKIMSLDSELRVLSAQLGEFEEKANSRQRLTQKSNSSALLKEEKFRKQMQNDFGSKMNSLWDLLNQWENIEGTKFDDKMLSAEVTALLENPEQFDDWVQRRTAFMHLKTIQQKPTRRHLTPFTSPKRPKTTETHTSTSTSSRPASSNSTSTSSKLSKALSKKRLTHDVKAGASTTNVESISKAKAADRPVSSLRKLVRSLSSSPKRHEQPKIQTSHESIVLTSKTLNKSSEMGELQLKPVNTKNNGPPISNNPFGRILAKTPTSQKENFRF